MSMKRVFILRVTKVLLLACALSGLNAAGQSIQPGPQATGAVALFRDLVNSAFNEKDVYQVREISILLEDLHISISDGTMAFMRAVNGHVTGAVFEGSGEVLLVPPNRAERTSLALFTGSAVLEQRFQTAYLRFSDDKVAEELRAGTRGRAEDPEAFIAKWQEPARFLSQRDALAVLQSMTSSEESASRYLHLRMGGTGTGVVDVYFDTNGSEQISVAQATVVNNTSFYDIWTSFPMRS
ncbi:MAG TPA: hypothetical protein VKU42_11085, partial [Candidatus Angelobacter sp.]|nr:hypothetical protein [Candidatus Angelobacter sp.]